MSDAWNKEGDKRTFSASFATLIKITGRMNLYSASIFSSLWLAGTDASDSGVYAGAITFF